MYRYYVRTYLVRQTKPESDKQLHLSTPAHPLTNGVLESKEVLQSFGPLEHRSSRPRSYAFYNGVGTSQLSNALGRDHSLLGPFTTAICITVLCSNVQHFTTRLLLVHRSNHHGASSFPFIDCFAAIVVYSLLMDLLLSFPFPGLSRSSFPFSKPSSERKLRLN